MNASKEAARTVLAMLERCPQLQGGSYIMEEQDMERVLEFLRLAERKLPTELSCRRNRNRNLRRYRLCET